MSYNSEEMRRLCLYFENTELNKYKPSKHFKAEGKFSPVYTNFCGTVIPSQMKKFKQVFQHKGFN